MRLGFQVSFFSEVLKVVSYSGFNSVTERLSSKFSLTDTMRVVGFEVSTPHFIASDF
jgi:hypothetical protein